MNGPTASNGSGHLPSESSENATLDDQLGPVERRMLEKGKKEHRETTERSQRALQVAEQTAELATATVIEVKRQGNVLDRTEHAVENVEKDVKEASRIMKFMQRWCCFQVLCCCDCFDPDVVSDRSRMRRLRERQQHDADLHESTQGRYLAQTAHVHRLASKADPAFNNDEQAARSELFAANICRKAASYEEITVLGYGLPDSDQTELQEQTRIQDQNLDRIGTTVDTLRIMSLELQTELVNQSPQIEALGDRVHDAHDNLRDLAKSARKV